MSAPVSSETAVDTRALRHTLGQFATGVTIVTCLADDDTPVGMTANSFSSVSLDPPLVLWSVDRRAGSFTPFAKAERFAFSVLAQDQVELSNRFAQPGAEKFSHVAWAAGLGGVPLIPDAAAHIECVQHATAEGGDHLIIIGRVERFERYDRRGLVFAHGRYGAVAPHPGGTPAGGVSMGDGHHPDDDFLVPLLFRAYNQLFRDFARGLAEADATGPQMRILSILSAYGPCAEETVLTRTMVSQSRFGEARDSLVAAGLIQRMADPTALAMTDAGAAKLAELLSRAVELERESTRTLDTSEVEILRAVLRKLVREGADQSGPRSGGST